MPADRLRRPVRVVLGSALVGSLAWGATYIPAGLARLEHFRVVGTEVTGLRNLRHAEVVEIAGIGRRSSVWDDFDVWVERLEDHPLVERAELRRELPGTLHIRVEEREPVALVAMPTLEPVDRDGRRLPLDPAELPLDLPILRLPDDPAHAGRPPSAIRILPLARMAERMRLEVTFWSRVSEMTLDEAGDIEASWGEPAVLFSLPTEIDPYRLREAVNVLLHALDDPDRTPRNVDLRYRDQVVVRYAETRGT